MRNAIPARKIIAVTNPRMIVNGTESEYKRQVLTTAINATPPTDAKRSPFAAKYILQANFILTNVFSRERSVNTSANIMPKAPDTKMPVPMISSGMPADPELDRMFSVAAIETTRVPKPKRTSPKFRDFCAPTILGAPISKFDLTKYVKKDVTPIVPRIVVTSTPRVFSKPTATTIQDNAKTDRSLSFNAKSEDKLPSHRDINPVRISGIRTWASHCRVCE
jgi:hypothetical protein